ncbi:MAG: alpha,alpha-trehalase TreF [Woeseia sp.]
MMQICTPDAIYAELFEAVQSSHVFADSKSFVDATPRRDPAKIMQSFRESARDEGFELESFITSNFELPEDDTESFEADPQRPVREQINLLWDVLTRAADVEDPNSSLIALPHPYVVPGGRFREIYYWDSYFTMLGLAASGRIDLVENMVDNFAYLIDQVGFIPNGNRSYYCTRSQPPFFALMVELLAAEKEDQSVLATYLPQLEKEYRFWMSGAENLCDELALERRVVAVSDGYLNRHWDDSDLPRQESFAEDVELAMGCDRDAAGLYRDIRCACESGWDFSSRWLGDRHSMASIRASQTLPVDLNAILWKLESTLADAVTIASNTRQAGLFKRRAEHRKKSIQSLFFDDDAGFFVDLLLPELQPTEVMSLAAAFPLFFGLATSDQASRVAERIHTDFLRPGGWVMTTVNSGQQWDAPNGWAPLQWIAYAGLKNYGYSDEAQEGASRWVRNNETVYRTTGRLFEKYNVEEIGPIAEGGEYTVQDGFGWTNGVLLSLLNEFSGA